MSIEEAILEKVRRLPPEKRAEVLKFADSLSAQTNPQILRRSPKGLWADLKVNISEEEITELRQELWKNFPRDDV